MACRHFQPRPGGTGALPAYLSVIIEHRDSVIVVKTAVVCLLEEGHVVFADFRNRTVGIDLGAVVPERQLALAWKYIGAKDSAIVLKPAHEC